MWADYVLSKIAHDLIVRWPRVSQLVSPSPPGHVSGLRRSSSDCLTTSASPAHWNMFLPVASASFASRLTFVTGHSQFDCQ